MENNYFKISKSRMSLKKNIYISLGPLKTIISRNPHSECPQKKYLKLLLEKNSMFLISLKNIFKNP